MTQSKLQYMHPDDLVPYYNNPRHNQDAVGPVAESIKAFGFKVPIVVDENLEVITGHTRLKAAKQLGLDKVPVIVAEDLDEDQVRAYRLADNKVAELASWDDENFNNVLHFERTAGEEREQAGGHATPKPLALVSLMLKSSTRPFDLVLDVFGGSGSTLIACEQLGRTCYMNELDPQYVDVIIRRWENLTGEKAVKLHG